MTLNVIQSNISFKGTLWDRARTDLIAVHHSDADPMKTVEAIHQEHLNKGWSGIGYHYYITGDGNIWTGRPEGKRGAHAYDSPSRQANDNGIGICLAGRFEQYTPTEAQLFSLIWLINDIQSRWGKLQLKRHSDICATACPGALFPWDNLLQRLAGNAVPAVTGRTGQDIVNEAKALGVILEDHNPDEPAKKWFVLQVAINIIKILKGR